MSVIPWPEIEGFHNIRKYLKVDPTEWWFQRQTFSGSSKVLYKAKVKLHGMNHAVQVNDDGSMVIQSRTTELTVAKDNLGFAKFVMANEKAWQQAFGFIIFGEWVGPGVQKSVAVSDIPKRIFAVFAARPLGDVNDVLIVEPRELAMLVDGIPDVYVLPWYDKEIEIDWRKTDEELATDVALINQWVSAVEENDPWVSATFGVNGTGEGLVFYPATPVHEGLESFTNLAFKAKGEAHRVIKAKSAVQLTAESAASVEQFVDMVFTVARAEQGVTKVSTDASYTFDMKLTGKFVAWIVDDVKKEAQDELDASGLDWKQVEKPLTTKAREWYLREAKRGVK
jgi:RNA ligase